MTMRLNDDLARRVLVHAGKLAWTASPSKGVERRMLFRVGEEKARATSIVRYAPGSRFPRHGHPGGEEFFVLEGTFQDETGDFSTGTYVRNPPGSGHAPRSEAGCVIFVKLWQFSAADEELVVRRPDQGMPGETRTGASSSTKLFEGAGERVFLEAWQPGAHVDLHSAEGLELLVIDGGFADGADTLGPWSWLRLPAGETLHAVAGAHGARVWYKAAPLLARDACAFPVALEQPAGRGEP